jgi:isoprenylcysteine carboxyl methyltransferase (ICMT) family protein YpbQ
VPPASPSTSLRQPECRTIDFAFCQPRRPITVAISFRESRKQLAHEATQYGCSHCSTFQISVLQHTQLAHNATQYGCSHCSTVAITFREYRKQLAHEATQYGCSHCITVAISFCESRKQLTHEATQYGCSHCITVAISFREASKQLIHEATQYGPTVSSDCRILFFIQWQHLPHRWLCEHFTWCWWLNNYFRGEITQDVEGNMSLSSGDGVSGAGGSIAIASGASRQGISTSSVANGSRPDNIRLLTQEKA